MTTVLRETRCGLVVAEQAMDEARLSRALREFDRRLVLQFRPPYYVVVCTVSDSYAPVVATWMDLSGDPLPLSSGLLEKVKAWHLGSRDRPETVDEYNDRKRAEREKTHADVLAAVEAEHKPYLQRGRVQVTLADVGKPRYWRREGARPRSAA